MLKYELGPSKALQNGVADTILWEQATIPTGSIVKAVTFIFTGTGHTVADMATLIFMKGGTQFMNFNNSAQLQALCDSLGKKTIASSVQRITVPMQNIYGWPIQDPMCAAPPVGLLSIQLTTSTGSSATGTVIPIFHIDPLGASNSYPKYMSQVMAPSGAQANVTYSITDEGAVLAGFIYDTTNVTTIRFFYAGNDLFPDLTPTQLSELEELWQGTTVTSPRTFWFPAPLPVVVGQTKFILTSSGTVGQIMPLLKQPIA
jgi:hypothetical protein